MDLELARIAQASLEAKPVSVNDDMAYAFHHAISDSSLGSDEVEEIKAGLRAAFANVTTQPAPVSVPDEVCWEDVPEEITEDDMALASAWAHGFNQCRAAMLKHSEPFIVTSDYRMMEMPQVEAINAVTAMLQGVENAETPTTMQAAPALDSSPKIAELPSGNSPVIPDGSEDTKRLDWLDAQNKRLNEYYGTSYGWKFDANFQRNAMMLNDSNYPVMSVRQAIDEAIAAAPQQEVKS
ncbi:hypothetical protein [Enterobacter hormaechei]|uniref:hypothetical protein n=1 Tax=Enterobacter hormaechei TaxID=158836 RepID=UPI003D6D3656